MFSPIFNKMALKIQFHLHTRHNVLPQLNVVIVTLLRQPKHFSMRHPYYQTYGLLPSMMLFISLIGYPLPSYIMRHLSNNYLVNYPTMPILKFLVVSVIHGLSPIPKISWSLSPPLVCIYVFHQAIMYTFALTQYWSKIFTSPDVLFYEIFFLLKRYFYR